MRDYQNAVGTWLTDVLGTASADNVRERGFRFLEEALELFQAIGGTIEDVQKMAEYTFGREAGEVGQEVGGTSVCLAALCHASGVDWEAAAGAELARIHTPEVIAKIRAKRASRIVPGDYSGQPA